MKRGGSSRRIPPRKHRSILDEDPILMLNGWSRFSYIETAEALTTPYEWGVYDILLLPPSFPYGGESDLRSRTLSCWKIRSGGGSLTLTGG